MLKSTRLIAGLVVPTVIAIYVVLFWRDTSHLQLAAAGFPRLLILLLGGLVIAQVVRDVRQEFRRDQPKSNGVSDETTAAPSVDGPMDGWRAGLKPMLVVIVFLAAYIFILPLVGAYPSTAAFVGGLMFALGYRRPLVIGLSMVICVALVGAFIATFNLPIAEFGS